MKNGNEKKICEAGVVTAAEDTPTGYRGGVRPSIEPTASDGASGAVGFLVRLRRFGAGARALIREVCTFELLGLCTMLLPALMASIEFFFGQTVTPLYFYVSVAILLVCAFVGGWKRGVCFPLSPKRDETLGVDVYGHTYGSSVRVVFEYGLRFSRE